MNFLSRNKHLVCAALSALSAILAVLAGLPLIIPESEIPGLLRLLAGIAEVAVNVVIVGLKGALTVLWAVSFVYPLLSILLGLACRLAQLERHAMLFAVAMSMCLGSFHAALSGFVSIEPAYESAKYLSDSMIFGMICAMSGLLLGQAWLCFSKPESDVDHSP